MNAHEEKLLLILNAGSSTLKFAVFNSRPALTRTFSGVVDRIGSSNASFTLSNIESKQMERAEISATDHVAGLEHLLERLSKTSGAANFSAVGHRVVHGGPRHHKPERVDNAMLSDLRSISAFGPGPIRCALRRWMRQADRRLSDILAADAGTIGALDIVDLRKD